MTKVLTEPNGFRVIFHGIPQPNLHSTRASALIELRYLRRLDCQKEAQQWMH